MAAGGLSAPRLTAALGGLTGGRGQAPAPNLPHALVSGELAKPFCVP